MSSGFAAASNLQLLRRDALLQNFGFQPQVLSIVRTAPFDSIWGIACVGSGAKMAAASSQEHATSRQNGRVVCDLPENDQGLSINTGQQGSKYWQDSTDQDVSFWPFGIFQPTIDHTEDYHSGQAVLLCRRRQGRPEPSNVSHGRKTSGASQAPAAGRRWRVTGGGSPGRLWVGLNFVQLPHLTHHSIAFRTRNSRQDLQQAADALLSKGAIERGLESSLGFYSWLFLVPKKTRHLPPVIDLFTFESSPGGAPLQNGNPGVRSSSHQKPRMDRLRRHKRCLSPCPNAQGRQKVPAIQSEQEDLPVHLSTFWIGNFTSGIYQASKTCRSLVKTARCQAARLLGRLADLRRVSSIKFQGHLGQKITNFDPNWAFPVCNSSSTSTMDLKWWTKLDVV